MAFSDLSKVGCLTVHDLSKVGYLTVHDSPGLGGTCTAVYPASRILNAFVQIFWLINDALIEHMNVTCARDYLTLQFAVSIYRCIYLPCSIQGMHRDWTHSTFTLPCKVAEVTICGASDDLTVHGTELI